MSDEGHGLFKRQIMELFYGKYRQESLLGRGAFSEVWKVTDIQTGVTQALKIYTASSAMGDDGVEMMKHEFALMANTNHQNLLRPLYFDICDQRPFLVLSFCKNGNIKSRVGKFTERDAWKLLRDAASGLVYLHQQTPPIIHQDIKPENILIADNGSYMLTDFGVSTKATSRMSQLASEDRKFQSAGTFPYMPPEKFAKDSLPIMASDIWALGATVYEMLTGDVPFGEWGGLTQKDEEVPTLEGNYTQNLKDTLALCLAKEPWARPLAEELESIAIQTLNSTPTVKPEQMVTVRPKPMQTEQPAPVDDEILAPIIDDAQDTEPVDVYADDEKPTTAWKKYGIWLAALLLIGGGAFFLLQTFVTPSTDSVSQDAQAVLAVPSDSMQTAQQDSLPAATEQATLTETVRQTAPAETSLKSEAQSQEQSVRTKKTQPRPSSGKKLGYGSWTGKTVNRKPVGIGNLTFTSSHTIYCSNGSVLNAQAGDRLESAEFDEEGYLYQGNWIKNNGETKHIMP